MKKLLIPFSFCLLLATLATAQDRKDFQRKAQHQIDKKELTQKLNLTEEQQQKMKAIQQDFGAKIKDLKSNDNITRGDFKKQMKTLQEQRKLQAATVLTNEQQQKLKDLKKEQHKEKSAARFKKLSNDLQLSTAQQATLKAKQKEIQGQIKAIKENETLAADDKKAQLKSLHKQQKDFLKSVLTKEQTEKFESMKRTRK